MNCIVLDLSAQVTKPLEGELWLYRTSKRTLISGKEKQKKRKEKREGRMKKGRTAFLRGDGRTQAARLHLKRLF